MANVPVLINGREYQLACDDGQEEQLVALAQEVDDRVRRLAYQLPHTTESMLLLLSSVMLADEMADMRRTIRQLEGRLHHATSHTPEARQRENEEKLYEIESAMAETLSEVTNRIEKIASQLENSYTP